MYLMTKLPDYNSERRVTADLDWQQGVGNNQGILTGGSPTKQVSQAVLEGQLE